MTHQEKIKVWQAKYSQARSIAERIDKLVWHRMRKLCQEAGLDPNLLGIHPHNAMCSYKAGRPWPNVDYSKVRKIFWLAPRQFAGYRLADKLADRIWKELF